MGIKKPLVLANTSFMKLKILSISEEKKILVFKVISTFKK